MTVIPIVVVADDVPPPPYCPATDGAYVTLRGRVVDGAMQAILAYASGTMPCACHPGRLPTPPPSRGSVVEPIVGVTSGTRVGIREVLRRAGLSVFGSRRRATGP